MALAVSLLATVSTAMMVTVHSVPEIVLMAMMGTAHLALEIVSMVMTASVASLLAIVSMAMTVLARFHRAIVYSLLGIEALNPASFYAPRLAFVGRKFFLER